MTGCRSANDPLVELVRGIRFLVGPVHALPASTSPSVPSATIPRQVPKNALLRAAPILLPAAPRARCRVRASWSSLDRSDVSRTIAFPYQLQAPCPPPVHRQLPGIRLRRDAGLATPTLEMLQAAGDLETADRAFHLGAGSTGIRVACAIAKMAHDLAASSRSLDFAAIWQRQAVDEPIREGIAAAAAAVHDVIVAPPAGIGNVTEWAKKQACWARVQSLDVAWPRRFLDAAISEDDTRERMRDDRRTRRALSGIEGQTAVLGGGGAFWQKALDWDAASGRSPRRRRVSWRSRARSTIRVCAGHPPEDTLRPADIAAAKWSFESDRPTGRGVDTCPVPLHAPRHRPRHRRP